LRRWVRPSFDPCILHDVLLGSPIRGRGRVQHIGWLNEASSTAPQANEPDCVSNKALRESLSRREVRLEVKIRPSWLGGYDWLGEKCGEMVLKQSVTGVTSPIQGSLFSDDTPFRMGWWLRLLGLIFSLLFSEKTNCNLLIVLRANEREARPMELSII
jgi:hypothetical protein